MDAHPARASDSDGGRAPKWLGIAIFPSRKDPHQPMPSHTPVQYALLTLLIILFRIDPESGQAVLTATALWEALNRTTGAH